MILKADYSLTKLIVIGDSFSLTKASFTVFCFTVVFMCGFVTTADNLGSLISACNGNKRNIIAKIINVFQLV